MYSSTMEKFSRNDLCPCGSGKKYKKCCLNKDSSELSRLMSASPDLFRPAALCLAGQSHVPAIACDDEANHVFLFILARVSRQMDDLEAAEEAAADLESIPGSNRDGLGPDGLRYLYKIGYRVMPGMTLDHVELLEDLVDEEDIEPADVILETLYETAEQQIREEDPPEVRQTLVRLRRAGIDRGEIMDMIVHVMMHESMEAAKEKGEVNISRYVRELARLPELSCEHEEE
jgi:SEC-C motif-containing protein